MVIDQQPELSSYVTVQLTITSSAVWVTRGMSIAMTTVQQGRLQYIQQKQNKKNKRESR